MDKDAIIVLVVVSALLLVLLPLLFISFRERKRTSSGHKEKEPFILDKGERGEYIVDKMLKEVCEYFGGYSYRGLKLEDEYGNWTEIDNVYIGPIGIYLIETKNRDGIIQGDISSKKWTQISGTYIHYLDNPIMQCIRHEKFFKRVIKNVGKVESLSIFVSGDISNIQYKNVFTLRDAEKYLVKQKRFLADSKVEYINSQVLKFINNPPFTHKQYSQWMENQKRTNSNFY